MLEKSLGLMFFLKQPRNYEGGEMYIYLKVTVDGVSKDLSVKRSWLPSRWNSKGNRANGNKEDARLFAKIMVWQIEQLITQQQSQWQEHNALERGNPVKTIKGELF